MDKIEKGNPLTQSVDFVKENLETLKRLFPTIVKEGKIDVDELKALIDDEVETSEEYYRFTWAGKSEARREANKPSTGTLRPNKADSKDWDTTGNIFIEGDNLEVLKLMQKSYVSKIKLIYIDPPYNTGKDFVYKDNYADNLGNYLAMSKQTDDEGNKLSTNTESDGRYHSNWLSMMYPRLKLARNLLTDDGVIFASIDDNEVHNFRKLFDEIFGEENFVIEIAWRKSDNQANIGSIARVKEYVLCYAKNKSLLKLNKIPLTEKAKKEYSYKDEKGNFRRAILLDKTRGRHFYNVTTKNGKTLNGPWMIKENEFNDLDQRNGILWTNSGDEQPYGKIYLHESSGQIANDFWDTSFGSNQEASIGLERLFNKRVFDFPKSTNLLKFICTIGSNNDSLILDFFAGAGSTAHAIMDLNTEDNGMRNFICVQLPESTEESSIAYNEGFKTISQITIERIKRAGNDIIANKKIELEKLKKSIEGKMLQEDIQSQIESLQSTINKLDIGFKAFKLDSSNIHSWDGSIENFEANLFNAQNNIKDDRTEEDVLFEILLKYGLDLTVPIQEKTIGKCKVYSIGAGVLFICLSDNINTDVAKAIGEWKNELEPATCRVLFKDNGFIDDVAKTNSVQILRQYGIEECNSI